MYTCKPTHTHTQLKRTQVRGIKMGVMYITMEKTDVGMCSCATDEGSYEIFEFLSHCVIPWGSFWAQCNQLFSSPKQRIA